MQGINPPGETDCIQALAARLPPLPEAEIAALAARLAASDKGGKAAMWLRAYPLHTPQGLSLVKLAEALPRIPDKSTADALIKGALAEAEGVFALASRLPLGFALRSGIKLMARQFVLGETIEQALGRAQPQMKKGVRFSFDMLGEGARSEAQAEAFTQAYLHAASVAPAISVKLSALSPRYRLTQEAQVMQTLLPRLQAIAEAVRRSDGVLAIDAEEAARLDISLAVFEKLTQTPALQGWEGLGFVLQAYAKRAPEVLARLSALSRARGVRFGLRLVKGAYWDGEIKTAQVQGLADYPVYTRKEHTDIAYLALADMLLTQRESFFPQFATHNARTAASIIHLARGIPKEEFEFQRLHGMGEGLHAALMREGYASRVYAPVGAHADLLAYLIRRLLENGANSSFVQQVQADVELALADPLQKAQKHGFSPHPHLPAPVGCVPWRACQGVDLGNRSALGALSLTAMPLTVADVTPPQVEEAAKRAHEAFPAWSRLPVEARAGMLEKAAALLEAQRDVFLSLIIREAGRTLPDALAEWREAVEFCRYYAYQARSQLIPHALPGPAGERNSLSLHGRGVFACISPWNFPLSIFTGQVAAALVAGNTVLAKPAEQTPFIAQAMVQLLHEAGVPKDALHLLCGAGESVGAALVASPYVHGVAFTGGTDTARRIQRALAEKPGPIGPFIAETGGLNAMVVDSSALLEAAVDDILQSAFGSAGQRCSSLRLLLVQDDVADALLSLLAGAMQSLQLGDPLDVSTDIGPLIDGSAKARVDAHIMRLKAEAKLVAHIPLPEGLKGHFTAPHLFELAEMGQLREEIFGPVLHAVRFRAGELETLATRISSSGYGLTFGLHSRVPGRAEWFASHLRVGNIYVNRSITGAVVGVQPFGGEGLSGTGPKAGSPHTLLRYCTERVLTVNTAAIGGNIDILINNS